MKLLYNELDIAYIYFRDFVTGWSHNSRCFLQDTNSRENDPLLKTSEKLSAIKNRIGIFPNLTNSVLTLRLLMSYIYGAPSKARNANVVYIWTYVW